MTEPATAPAPVALVPIRAADGTIGHVAEADVAQAVNAGAEVVGQNEIRQQELQDKYGGLGGMAASAGAGAARGLTLGLSDVVARGVGGSETAKTLLDLQEANPTTSTAFELGGAIAPIALSGGAGAAVEGGGVLRGLGMGIREAGLIPRAASAAGGLAERGAAALMGEGAASLGGRIAQKAIPQAVGAAVEGAAWGAGHEASDAALHDHDLTAEKLLAGAGHGAIWGALAGGGLATAGELAATGMRGLGNAVTKRLEGTNISEWLDKKSGEFAFRSAGGTKNMTAGADRFAGGHAEVGKIWRDEAPALVGKSSFKDMTREELSEAASIGLKRDGERLGNVLTQVDEKAAAVGALPKAKDVVQDIEDVIAKVKERAGSGPIVNKLRSFSEDVQRITGISVKENVPGPMGMVANDVMAPNAADITISYSKLRDFRRDADNIWAGSKVNPDLFGFREEFKAVRDSLEQRVTKGVEEMGGKELRAEYADAKAKYQAFKLLGKATESGVAAQGTNRFLSLTDHIVGSATGMMGSAVGGPVGGLVAGGLGALGNHAMRTHADFFAADLLGKAAKMNAIERASAEVDAKIAAGVRGFLKSESRTAVAAAKEEHRDSGHYERVAKAFIANRGNAAVVQDHIDRTVGNLGEVAPNVSSALATRMALTYGNLEKNAPSPRINQPSITPQFDRPRFTEVAVRKFSQQIESDPISVLDDMATGQLTRAKAQAMRENFPKLFEQVQTEVYNQAAELQESMSYEKRQTLSILMGVPLDETQTPAFVAMMQATKQANPDKPQDGASGPKQVGHRPMDLNTNLYQTDATSGGGR